MFGNDTLTVGRRTFKEYSCPLVFGLAFFGFWLLLGTPSPISASSATITLSPDEGPVGTSITVEGSGFAPSAEVSIQFGEDHASLSQVYADELGEFTAEFDIPQYTPAGNKTVTASDNSVDENSASSVFLVLNTAPIAASHPSVSIAQDSPELIMLSGSDVNGDSLAFFIIDGPSHGALSDFDSDHGELLYTPETGYIGTDQFSFGLNDGDLDSNESMITIHVAEEGDDNSAPVPEDQSVNTNEDTPVDIVLEAYDLDGDELEFTIEDEPLYGTLEGSAPNLVYTPFPGYVGLDSFTFSVDDGMYGSTSLGTVEITIAEVNDLPEAEEDDEDYYDGSYDEGIDGYENAAPVANSQSITGTEDTPIYVNLTASNADDDSLTFVIIDYPLHGNISGFHAELGTMIYTPLTDYSGPDSFLFTASDDYDDSETAIVSINITAVNDPPQAVGQNLAIDNSANITLIAFDPEGDPLSYAILSEPSYGIITGTAPRLLYNVTDPDFTGGDRFTFVVSDGQSQTVGAVLITVRDPTELPDESGRVSDHGIPDDGDGVSRPSSGPPGDSTNDGADGASTRLHVEKGNTIVQLSWEHNHQTSGAESTLNLQFSDRMTRLPLGGHVWYDLVILDDDNREIFSKQDLIALNSADIQKIVFPENAAYRVEVTVKGVIDKSNNSVSQDGAYTGTAIGTVVVPEFSSVGLMIVVVIVMSSIVASYRFAGKCRR